LLLKVCIKLLATNNLLSIKRRRDSNNNTAIETGYPRLKHLTLNCYTRLYVRASIHLRTTHTNVPDNYHCTRCTYTRKRSGRCLHTTSCNSIRIISMVIRRCAKWWQYQFLWHVRMNNTLPVRDITCISRIFHREHPRHRCWKRRQFPPWERERHAKSGIVECEEA